MLRIVPYSKNNTLLKRNNDFYNLFDDFFNDSFFNEHLSNSKSQNLARFKVDVKNEENQYVILADLPGVNKDEISIDYKDNQLTIRVDRQEEKEETKDNYLHRERIQSSMERSFYAKDIQGDGISAKLENGVLTIVAPKYVEQDTSYKIPIQ